jgi:hypothetical protein
MSGFKPKSNYTGEKSDKKYPVPELDGLQFARVSMIVDLGTQPREPFSEVYDANNAEHKEALATRGAYLETAQWGNNKGKECIYIPQTPKAGIAVFVDLVENLVDYGSDIGKKPFRLMLNKNFKGEITPIPFYPVKPVSDGGMWTFAGSSLLSKLATACDKPEVIGKGTEDQNMDVSLLLGQPLNIDIEIVTNESNGKSFTNVRYKGMTRIRKTDEVPELSDKPLLITFDCTDTNVVKMIRKDVRAKMMESPDFPTSKIAQTFAAAGLIDSSAVQAAQQEQSNDKGDDAPDANQFDEESPF